MKKNDILNYPRKLIVRIALLIILLSTVQETFRHHQMIENFRAVREIALQYGEEKEEMMMKQEEVKRIKTSDTLNVAILILKLSCLIAVLYSYDKKYFNKK